MKTLENFVDELNDKWRLEEDFELSRIYTGEKFLIFRKEWVMGFDKNDFSIRTGMAMLKSDIQKDIIKYALETNPDDWFKKEVK